MIIDNFNEKTFFILAIIACFSGFTTALIQLRRRKSYSQSIIYISLFISFIFQSIGLNMRAQAVSGCPLGNIFEIIQFILWSLILLFILIRPIIKIKVLGIFTTLSTCIFSTLSLCVPLWDLDYEITTETSHTIIELHASIAIFSYAIFMLLAIVSLMLLIQEFGLKKQIASGLYNQLPAIQILDKVATKLLWIGSFTLFSAIVLAIFYWFENPNSVPIYKLFISLIIALSYYIIGFLKSINKLSAQKQAIIVIAIFLFSLLSLGYISNTDDLKQLDLF